MMVPYQYTYLVIDLAGLLLWSVLFLIRKDLRREMITMSLIIATIGFFANYMWWTKDWWTPPTITGTRVGVEDIINGFVTGGITAVLYEEIFKRRLYRYKSSKNHSIGALFVILAFFAVSSFLFYLLKIPSFIATPIAFTLSGILILIHRKDLFFDAILTAVCLVLALAPFYILVELLSPSFINNFYITKNLSGIYLLGIIPIEDIFFYFSTGLVGGPFYLYWKGERLRKPR